ncbi:MAG: nucleotide exchange factor GrpE [Firmicutes bacterium]|nr:nucleotide exchange factor GrpE [Bacillota bacterium]
MSEDEKNIPNENLDEELDEAEETAEENQSPEDVIEEKTEEKTEEESELDKAVKEAKAANDKYLRLFAEFDNFRKRTSSEKAGMYDNGVRDTIEKFLPVIDNLERALSANVDEEDPMYKGVAMIMKQINELFESMKVIEISEVGVPFDPNIHNAVMHVEDENFDENSVAEVLQKGYSYHDKIIRPAMIKAAN